MEKTLRFIAKLFFITFFFYSIPAFADEITLSFRNDFNRLSLDILNDSNYEWVIPFKRRSAVVFLISNEKGFLFKDKNWDLLPANCPSNGLLKFIPSKKKGKSSSFGRTYLNLTHFIPSDKSSLRPTDFPRLFVKAMLKNPGQKADSFISTSIHELIVQNNRISEIKGIPEESVPNEVKLTFEKEINVIVAEENSPEYGYW